MSPFACLRLLACALLTPLGAGCGDVTPATTAILPTPPSVLEPKAPDATPPGAEAEIQLIPLKFDELQAQIRANPTKARYTLVDAWATYCPPCKENFPHLVEMHAKYGAKGLRVISASFDDPDDAKSLAEAKKFLIEKKAGGLTNVLVNEESNGAFDKFNVNAIPAVFLYGPDGKEVRRFTMDDPDKQFTYAQVEEVVRGLLAGQGEGSGKSE